MGKGKRRFLPLPDLSRKIEGDSVRRVLSTRLSKAQCYKHTFSENFGLCLNMYLFQVYSLLSSQVFRAQMLAGCWVERRLAEMSERDPIEVPVHP